MTSIVNTEIFSLAISKVETIFDYRFKEIKIAQEAITHKSFAFEQAHLHLPFNERLEFLGDAVLELIVTDLLMAKFPDCSEGELSRMRAAIVNEFKLYEIALTFGLGDIVLLGKGEETTRGRHKSSILSNTYEALIAAIYIDGGYDSAYKMVAKHFEPTMGLELLAEFDRDFKTRLQEEIQRRYKTVPVYKVIKAFGPDHDKTFEVAVEVKKGAAKTKIEMLGSGFGKSKKEAEQDAAKKALSQLRAV